MTERSEPRSWEDRLAEPMFWLALLYLVVFAGLIHRFPRAETPTLEKQLISGLLAFLWLLFLPDAAYRFRLLHSQRGLGAALLHVLVILIAPPVRMGARGILRPGQIWLPSIGWQIIDNDLRRRLERLFSVPMILIALMILPLLGIEHMWQDEVHSRPLLALALDIGISIIWLAFAIELIIMVSTAKKRFEYAYQHWVDLAIVLLPVLEVMVSMLEEIVEALPMLRLLRLSRILRLDMLTRFGRLYRLRGLAFKAWRAFLVLEVIQRVMRQSPERRLLKLEELLRAKEDEVVELRREIDQLKEQQAAAIRAKETAELPVVQIQGDESCASNP